MIMMTRLIGYADSHEELLVRMDSAGRPEFVKEVHTDDEIRPRIAQRGKILRMGYTRAPDLAHGLHTGS
jgi:hypothetical protein